MSVSRKRRWLGPLITASIVAALLFLLRPLDQTYAVFFDPVGQADSGAKFGVSVGMSLDEARSALARRGWSERDQAFVDGMLASGWRCAGRELLAEETAAMFLDRSWRTGVVCLYVKDNEIETVAWVFSPISL